MTDFDFTADMSALHELIQMLYQGSHKFIVFSNVEDDAWIIHLALTNTTRWWKGSWTERDLCKFVGHQLTTELAETLSAGLANSIVNGELHVGNWSADKGAEIYLALGPTSKKPVHVTLAEMEPLEALKYATSTFVAIADYAQDKKCKLYPSPYETGAGPSSSEPLKTSHTTDTVPAPSPSGDAAPSSSRSESKKAAKPLAPEPTLAEKKAQDRIKKLEAELAKEKRKAPAIEARQTEGNLLKSRAKGSGPAVRAVKGASLANPNKKARKYQELEFEED